MPIGDRQVLRLFVSAGDVHQFGGRGVPLQPLGHVRAGAYETEEDFVVAASVFEGRRREVGQEVDVERARRLSGRALIGTAEEEVARSHDVVVRPLDFIGPDRHSRHMSCCRRVQNAGEDIEVVAIVDLGDGV